MGERNTLVRKHGISNVLKFINEKMRRLFCCHSIY